MGKATVIPFGPQHPVLPEPLHLDLVVEDEKVIEAMPQIGFVHRGLEKLVETRDYNQFIYVAERICGICAFGHSLGYAETVEQLMGVEVPDSAPSALRVMLARALAYPLASPVAGPCRRRLRLREPVHALLAPARARARHLREDHRAGASSCSVVQGRRRGARYRRRHVAPYVKQVLDGIKDEYRQIMNTLLTDTSVKNRLVGVGLRQPRGRRSRISMVGPFRAALRA